MSNENKDAKTKKSYDFGGVSEFDLQQIEKEVLNDSIYLDVFAGSDISFKENISEFTQMTPELLKLRPVSYNYKKDTDFSQNPQLGFIANEIETVFPELVAKDEDGKRYVNYAGLTPVLTKSIQELHTVIEKQQGEIEELKELVRKLTK